MFQSISFLFMFENQFLIKTVIILKLLHTSNPMMHQSYHAKGYDQSPYDIIQAQKVVVNIIINQNVVKGVEDQ